MLVVSRSIGQKIVIYCPDGSVIEIVPCRLQPGRIRIGVEAPTSYRILRAEIEDDGRERPITDSSME